MSNDTDPPPAAPAARRYAKDTRYSVDSAATHDGQTMTAVGCLRLSEVSEEQIAQHDVIAIDEGQFFPDLEQYAELWANAGKCVIVAALDADYRRCVFRKRGGACPGGVARYVLRNRQKQDYDDTHFLGCA